MRLAELYFIDTTEKIACIYLMMQDMHKYVFMLYTHLLVCFTIQEHRLVYFTLMLIQKKVISTTAVTVMNTLSMQ